MHLLLGFCLSDVLYVFTDPFPSVSTERFTAKREDISGGQVQPGTGDQKWGPSTEIGDIWSPYCMCILVCLRFIAYVFSSLFA